MGNPFDQFDSAPTPTAANPFDQFDAPQGAFKARHLGPLNAPLTAFGDFTDQMTRAATLGLGDKAAALADTTAAYGARGLDYLRGAKEPSPVSQSGKSFSDIYHDALAQQRSYGDAYAAAHPIASPIATGLGVAGGIGSVAGQAARLAALIPGARVASKLANPELLSVAKGGAVVGGLAGLGSTNDQSLAEDVGATAAGGAAGAAAGAGAKAVGPLLTKGAQALLDTAMMHKFQEYGPIAALLEGMHNPKLAAGGLGAWLGLKGLGAVPPSTWAQIAPYAARGAGANAPGILDYYGAGPVRP